MLRLGLEPHDSIARLMNEDSRRRISATPTNSLSRKTKPARIDWSNSRAKARAGKDAIELSEKGKVDEAIDLLHNCILASCQYSVGAQKGIYPGNGDALKLELLDTATDHVISMFQRLNPQDPLEEMLLTQAIITHARIMSLNKLAMEQDQRSNVHVVNEAADRAAISSCRGTTRARDARKGRSDGQDRAGA